MEANSVRGSDVFIPADQRESANGTSIFIAVSNSTFCQAISKQLSAKTNYKIVGQATTSSELIGQLGSVTPKVVILEHSLQGMGGTACVRFIKSKSANIRILMLMDSGHPAEIEAVLEAGADGCCLRQAVLDIVDHAVPVIAAGGLWLSPLIRQTMELHKQRVLQEKSLRVHRETHKFRVGAVVAIALLAVALTACVIPILNLLENSPSRQDVQTPVLQPSPIFTGGKTYRIIEMR